MEGVNGMKYLVIVEKAEANYSAYVPDLPGCVATGRTPGEAQERIREAIAMHLEAVAIASKRAQRRHAALP